MVEFNKEPVKARESTSRQGGTRRCSLEQPPAIRSTASQRPGSPEKTGRRAWQVYVPVDKMPGGRHCRGEIWLPAATWHSSFPTHFFCFHSHPAGLVRYRIRSTAASFILTRTFVPFLFSLVWLALTIDGSNSSSRRFLLHVVDHTYLHFLRKWILSVFSSYFPCPSIVELVLLPG